jgi:hypothetical protein
VEVEKDALKARKQSPKGGNKGFPMKSKKKEK